MTVSVMERLTGKTLDDVLGLFRSGADDVAGLGLRPGPAPFARSLAGRVAPTDRARVEQALNAVRKTLETTPAGTDLRPLTRTIEAQRRRLLIGMADRSRREATARLFTVESWARIASRRRLMADEELSRLLTLQEIDGFPHRFAQLVRARDAGKAAFARGLLGEFEAAAAVRQAGGRVTSLSRQVMTAARPIEIDLTARLAGRDLLIEVKSFANPDALPFDRLRQQLIRYRDVGQSGRGGRVVTFLQVDAPPSPDTWARIERLQVETGALVLCGESWSAMAEATRALLRSSERMVMRSGEKMVLRSGDRLADAALPFALAVPALPVLLVPQR